MPEQQNTCNGSKGISCSFGAKDTHGPKEMREQECQRHKQEDLSEQGDE